MTLRPYGARIDRIAQLSASFSSALRRASYACEGLIAIEVSLAPFRYDTASRMGAHHDKHRRHATL